MPIRRRVAGTMDEADLQMLESVLSRLVDRDEEEREHRAMQLIQFFQSGVTDPDELLNKVKATF